MAVAKFANFRHRGCRNIWPDVPAVLNLTSNISHAPLRLQLFTSPTNHLLRSICSPRFQWDVACRPKGPQTCRTSIPAIPYLDPSKPSLVSPPCPRFHVPTLLHLSHARAMTTIHPAAYSLTCLWTCFETSSSGWHICQETTLTCPPC